MDPTVSFIIITMNRFGDLEECVESIRAQTYDDLEIVVVDNDSEYESYAQFCNRYDDVDEVRVVRSDENRGVAGGRNFGLQHVRGDVVITIDDDAVIEDPGLTSRVVGRLQESDDVGVLAFRITNYYSRELEKNHFPSKDKTRSPDEEFETTWFIGAGHAIKREVYETVGPYRDYFPYGHEELDLSLRILDHGYRIIYFPDAEVFHKQSPESRVLASNSADYYANQLSKRIQVALHNLPWPYVITTSLVRTVKYALESGFNLYAILWAYWKIVENWGDIMEERKVISEETISKVLRLRGPVLY
jgi:GT2 family glycosyltransferase